MYSDYVDNWEALPEAVRKALAPVLARFDEAADLLFDRRRNLSFEAAVKELSVPGVAALTDGLRQLGRLLPARVTVADAAEGALWFDGMYPLTAYDLPLYTPCLYLSQLAQAMEEANVRVWKDTTAAEIVETLLVMARYVRPDIETARVLIAALHDMAWLYPDAAGLLQAAGGDAARAYPNAGHIASVAWALLQKKNRR